MAPMTVETVSCKIRAPEGQQSPSTSSVLWMRLRQRDLGQISEAAGGYPSGFSTELGTCCACSVAGCTRAAVGARSLVENFSQGLGMWPADVTQHCTRPSRYSHQQELGLVAQVFVTAAFAVHVTPSRPRCSQHSKSSRCSARVSAAQRARDGAQRCWLAATWAFPRQELRAPRQRLEAGVESGELW